jgi:hypothetical protein
MGAPRITITAPDLEDLALSDATKQYLIEHGLPNVEPGDDRPFGVGFCVPFAHQVGRRRYVVFGSEDWAPELYLTIKAGMDRVVAPAGPFDRGDVYVNANIADFVDFYQRACPLWVLADGMPSDIRTDQRTHTEVLASIKEMQEKYASGELTLEPDPREVELTAAAKKLKAELKAIDPRAVRGSSWWGRCLLYTSPSPRDRTRSRMPSSA